MVYQGVQATNMNVWTSHKLKKRSDFVCLKATVGRLSSMTTWLNIWPKIQAMLIFITRWYSGWWLTYPSEKYENQLGWLFPIYGNIKHVPNHQPVLDARKPLCFPRVSKNSLTFLNRTTLLNLSVGLGGSTGLMVSHGLSWSLITAPHVYFPPIHGTYPWIGEATNPHGMVPNKWFHPLQYFLRNTFWVVFIGEDGSNLYVIYIVAKLQVIIYI